MEENLTQKLYKRFPKFFQWRRPRQYKNKLLSWFSWQRHSLYWYFLYDKGKNLEFLVLDDERGFVSLECGDGWFDLIWDMCLEIEKLRPPSCFHFEQIKEKFGSLRAYNSYFLEFIEKVIDVATERSKITCEICGKKSIIRQINHWYTTRCYECEDK